MAKITLEWLRQEATPTSYQRGGQYYDNVGVVTKSGNYYQAEVAGSTVYQVNLEESSIDVHGFCSCPYSGIGICKHIVAVSLNILDGNFTETETADNKVEFSLVENVTDDEPAPAENNFYQNIFLQATPEQQAQFLSDLFEQNAALRDLFEQFIHPANTSTADYIAAQEIYQSIRRRLPALEFQYESENEVEAFRYENDDLNADNYAEIFAPFGQKVVTLLKEENLSNGLRILYGIYAAVQDLEQLEWRDYAAFADNLYDLKFPFIEWELTAADQLKEMEVSVHVAKTAVALLFQSESLFPLKNAATGAVQFVPAQFANLLRVLTQAPEVAKYLLTLLDEGQYYYLENAHLYLYLLEKLKEQERWVQVSEDFASNSPIIAKQLLQFYYDENNQTDFHRLAQASFGLFPDAVSGFLLKKIEPENDRNLYVEILKQYIEHKNDIALYRKLRNYLNAKERQAFIEHNYFDSNFYVQLLEVEQRYQDILEFVRQHTQHFHLVDIIKPILQIFPAECYDILTQRAVQDIHTGEQSRGVYKRIATNLQPILMIKGYEKEAPLFGKKLKKKYSSLPIFVEELKKVGF